MTRASPLDEQLHAAVSGYLWQQRQRLVSFPLTLRRVLVSLDHLGEHVGVKVPYVGCWRRDQPQPGG
jgi:hypothetical protein